MTDPRCLASGDGYLSEKGIALAMQQLTHTGPLADCVLEIVALCYVNFRKLENEDQRTSEGQQRVFAGIVLARLLEVSEALIHLARGGFGNEVNASFRGFLEAYFLFGNATSVQGFVQNYLKTDKCTRLTLMNQAEKHQIELFRLTREYATPAVKDALKQEIQASGAKQLSTYDSAVAINCAHLYDSMYRVLSATAHSSPRSLEPYVSENAEGVVTEIKLGPALGDIPLRLYDLGCFLLKVHSGFNDMYKADVAANVQAFQYRLDRLVSDEK